MNNRFYSLDVFRGATIALMILVNNPGNWSYIFSPLEHADWVGCTPTDLVFPFFLFAVGNALSFVIPKFKEKKTSDFIFKVLKRSLIIFFIGVMLNWLPFFTWEHNILVFKEWGFINIDKNGVLFEDGIRLLGVLQRIAICYFFASLIAYFFTEKIAIYISVAILLLYWLLCYYFGGINPYTLGCFFGNNIDIALIGKHHLLHIDKFNDKVFHFDYEGLVSTTTCIVQVLIGYFIGNYILKHENKIKLVKQLFTLSLVFIVCGYLWGLVFPISKKMWTSSYTVYTSGLAIFTIAVLIYLTEIKNIKNSITRFFDVFGKNPLFIFVLSGFLPRVFKLIRINDINEKGEPIILSPFSWFYENICKHISSDLRIGSLAYAIVLIVFYWLICYILDKKKIYIKV